MLELILTLMIMIHREKMKDTGEKRNYRSQLPKCRRKA
jgi:hypothetical protein